MEGGEDEQRKFGTGQFSSWFTTNWLSGKFVIDLELSNETLIELDKLQLGTSTKFTHMIQPSRSQKRFAKKGGSLRYYNCPFIAIFNIRYKQSYPLLQYQFSCFLAALQRRQCKNDRNRLSDYLIQIVRIALLFQFQVAYY